MDLGGYRTRFLWRLVDEGVEECWTFLGLRVKDDEVDDGEGLLVLGSLTVTDAKDTPHPSCCRCRLLVLVVQARRLLPLWVKKGGKATGREAIPKGCELTTFLDDCVIKPKGVVGRAMAISNKQIVSGKRQTASKEVSESFP